MGRYPRCLLQSRGATLLRVGDFQTSGRSAAAQAVCFRGSGTLE